MFMSFKDVDSLVAEVTIPQTGSLFRIPMNIGDYQVL